MCIACYCKRIAIFVTNFLHLGVRLRHIEGVTSHTSKFDSTPVNAAASTHPSAKKILKHCHYKAQNSNNGRRWREMQKTQIIIVWAGALTFATSSAGWTRLTNLG